MVPPRRAVCLGKFRTSLPHESCEIPLLLSLPMIERKLQAVIDFPTGCVHFSIFGVEVPVVKICQD